MSAPAVPATTAAQPPAQSTVVATHTATSAPVVQSSAAPASNATAPANGSPAASATITPFTGAAASLAVQKYLIGGVLGAVFLVAF